MQHLMIGIVVASQDLWEELQSVLHDQPIRVVMEQREIGDWGDFLEKLERVRPDVLIVDMKELQDPLENTIRQIKATSGSPMVIVAHTSAEPEVILKAIRSHADEYIYPPVKDDLTNAVRRMLSEQTQKRAGTRPRGKVLGFLSAKGGCGATTTTCHLAAELHRLTNLQVLVADFDIEGGIVGFLLKTQNRYSVLDAVANVHRLDLSFWQALVSNGVPGVEVIAAPPTPGAHRDHDLEQFRDVLRFVRSNYDWTLVDLGRGLSPLSMTVLEELDQVFLVTTLEIPALHQTKKIVQTLLQAGFAEHRLNVLMNRLPKRTDITRPELERMLGAPIRHSVMNDYRGLHDAYAEGGLVSPKSKLGKDYGRVAAKIAGVDGLKTKKRSYLGL